MKYLKSSLFKKSDSDGYNFMLEINVIYSEVYQMPTVYFIITDLDENKIINFDDYMIRITKGADIEILKKNFEVSRTVNYNL